MKRNWMVRMGAALLVILLLWWLFWAILADEDVNTVQMPDEAVVEQAAELFPAFLCV